jgi:hypothetical protein
VLNDAAAAAAAAACAGGQRGPLTQTHHAETDELDDGDSLGKLAQTAAASDIAYHVVILVWLWWQVVRAGRCSSVRRQMGGVCGPVAAPEPKLLTRDIGSLPDTLGTRHGRFTLDGAQPEHCPK